MDCRKIEITLGLCLVFVLPARAERLNAVWIGPAGNGGAGNWNTPANWNLGVVPNNGSDGDGDGLPDTFDVQIDGTKPAASSAIADSAGIEIANLAIDAGDTVEVRSSNFVLRDADSIADVINNGTLRVYGLELFFWGEAVRLSGNGVLELGIESGSPGYFTALNGGRIVNGPGHTIRTARLLQHSAYVLGENGGLPGYDVALTNEGTVLAEDSAHLRMQLNGETHVNDGTIRTANVGHVGITSDAGGTFRNRGLISATDRFSETAIGGLNLVNEADGVVRASNLGTVTLGSHGNVAIRNHGLIEATDRGIIQITGKNIINQGAGVVHARLNSTILLTNGTFRPDPSIRLLDTSSTLTMDDNALFENEGDVLSPGVGTLRLERGAHVRGGELTNGIGAILMNSPLLEDIALSGVATVYLGMRLKGTITVDSSFHAKKFDFAVPLSLTGDATLRGPGTSKFERTSFDSRGYTLQIAHGHEAVFDELTIRGRVLNNGTLHSSIDLRGGVLSGNGRVIGGVWLLWDNYGDSAISPGDGIGTMSIEAVGFSSGKLIAELGSSTSDLLDIERSLSLGSHAELVLTGGEVGNSYVIAQYGAGRYGEFKRVTPGYDVIYDDVAKQIRVQVIPEPAGVVLGLMGLVGGLFVLRAGRKRISRAGIRARGN